MQYCFCKQLKVKLLINLNFGKKRMENQNFLIIPTFPRAPRIYHSYIKRLPNPPAVTVRLSNGKLILTWEIKHYCPAHHARISRYDIYIIPTSDENYPNIEWKRLGSVFTDSHFKRSKITAPSSYYGMVYITVVPVDWVGRWGKLIHFIFFKY